MRILWRGIQKVIEEVCELGAEGARLNAFPVGDHPNGKGPVIVHLLNEMADVTAAIRFFVHKNGFALNDDRINEKIGRFIRWDRKPGMSGIPVAEMVNLYVKLADDPLHPNGRCTCGGEGACEWCTSHPEVYSGLDGGALETEVSYALIAQGARSGTVLQYRGPDISNEIEEVGLSELDDLGLDDAPEGMSVWTGRYAYIPGYVDGVEAPGEGQTEPRGTYRRLTRDEWFMLMEGMPLWPSDDMPPIERSTQPDFVEKVERWFDEDDERGAGA